MKIVDKLNGSAYFKRYFTTFLSYSCCATENAKINACCDTDGNIKDHDWTKDQCGTDSMLSLLKLIAINII